MSRRRGFTLIEVVTAGVIGAALMGIAVGLLYALMRAEGGSRQHVRLHTAMAQLAEQFRRDVHAAEKLETTAAGWQLTIDSETHIEYRSEGGRLMRSKIAGGKTQEQDQFVLTPDTRFQISPATASPQPAAAGPGSIVTLRLVPPDVPTGDRAFLPAEFQALLGYDRRWEVP